MASERTETYLAGTRAIVERRFEDAVEVLSREPKESTCYVLALGNLALALNNLGRHRDAELRAKQALAEIETRGCVDPGSHVQFCRNLAEATLSLGRPREALAHCKNGCRVADDLIRKHPEHVADIEIQKAHTLSIEGCALLTAEDPREARKRFEDARRIFRRHQYEGLGYAECLTNLAHALQKLGKDTDAELSLKEALQSARRIRNDDQIWRIVMALARLGSTLVRSDEVLQMSRNAAEAAIREGRPGTAYLRLSIGAQILQEDGEVNDALRLIAEARQLEPNLDAKVLDPAILRRTEAELYEDLGRMGDGLNALLEGARLWFDKLLDPDAAQDLRGRIQNLHDHFRLLSRSLLRAGRVEESFVSFEVGRGLGHALLVEPASFVTIVRASPFNPKEGKVSLDLLTNIQGNLKADEVLITLAIIPPMLVAFCVSRDNVTTTSVPLPQQKNEHAFLEDVWMIPARLQGGVGRRAMPNCLTELASGVQQIVGTRRIEALAPYGALHNAPWRAMLRAAGMSWDQIGGEVDFNLIARSLRRETGALPLRCVAVAYGSATVAAQQIDFGEEATALATAFENDSKQSECFLQCDSVRAQYALSQNGIILFSCHGATPPNSYRLYLELADGNAWFDELLPQRVPPNLVILSACESGVYGVEWGDFPIGAAPLLVQRGTRYCVGARFTIRPDFSSDFVQAFGRSLLCGSAVRKAFVEALGIAESNGWDLWRDLACVEIVGGP